MTLRRPKILITAGPTREMLDPVRFLSNRSTGKMGYAVAEAVWRKGWPVTLISGPTAFRPPRGVRVIPVISAADMKSVCQREFGRHDILVMSAAVCDFTAAHVQKHKIRRKAALHIHLKKTPDIIAALARRKGRRLVIGFCLETRDWLQEARKKIRTKHLDGIVANYYTAAHIPFGDRKIRTAFMDRSGKTVLLKKMSKARIAAALLRWIGSLEKERTS